MATQERKMELNIAPVISAERNRRVAFRTQVKIIDVEYGFLLPEVFMPIAEKTKQASLIFDWALEELFLIADRFLTKGIDYEFISIYAPPRILEDTLSVEKLIKDVKASDLHLDHLALEVYPETLFDRESNLYKNVEKLRKLGVKIIILGYACENFPLSSLSYMPSDIMVIDKYVIDCLSGFRGEKEYANTVLNMAANLGKKIMTEDVHTKKNKELLWSVVDYANGNYLGKFIKYHNVRVRWSEKG